MAAAMSSAHAKLIDANSGTFFIDNVALERTGTAVPEPAALALLGLGLAGLALAGRRRKA